MKHLSLVLLLGLVIFSSCKLKEAEDTVTGSDGTSVDLLLIHPNGGDTLKDGTTYEIQWDGSTNSLINIEFTNDNGSTWVLIVDSVANTGTYQWFPVPNMISNQCMVRISTVNASEADQSDAVFSIVRNSNKSLSLKEPNGGDGYSAGTELAIKWYSAGIDSVRIEYTTNNGRNWLLIDVDKRNTGIYFWDPIPNTPSTLAKIRIMDAEEGYPMDESDSFFEIEPEPNIVVNVPNGGEQWLSGTDQRIEWYSENVQNVKIDYTTNSGYSWNSIVTSTPSVGFYIWENIHDHYSSLCKIRVADADDQEPWDISNGPFTITNQVVQQINITKPNGEEEWEAGTNQEITWQATGIDNFNIEFTTNNGVSWSTIANDVGNSGFYAWNVPDSPSPQCKVRISDAADGTPVDESNDLFTIKQNATIKLLYPNGGEVLRAGTTFSILWESTGIENVKIQYTKTNAIDDWHTLVASTQSDGVYETSFNIPSQDYRIRISNAITGSPQDESDATFTVLPPTSLTITYPDGGESWLVGETYEITWTGENIQRVKLQFTYNGGATWNNIVTDTENDGSYLWTVTQADIANMSSYLSDLCRISVSEYNANDPNLSGAYDESDTYFSLYKNKHIRIMLPNGGEEWSRMTTNTIRWFSIGVDAVKIEYTLNNGQNWIMVNDNYPSYGAYEWLTPDISSTLARIRITDVAETSLKDESDNVFTISTPAPFIAITNPVQNSVWPIGTNKEIKWINSVDITKVDIEYSIDNGNNWTVIVNDIISPELLENVYIWNVVGPISTVAKIRIIGYNEGVKILEKVSDTFTIN